MTLRGVTVHVCEDGCAGAWFPHGELALFDDPAEPAESALLNVPGNPEVHVDPAERRRCPVCPDSVLMRHFASAKRAVTVDECPTCAGTWLDVGELERIRSEFPSKEAKKRAMAAQAEVVLVDDRLKLIGTQIGGQLPADTTRSRVVSGLLVLVYLVVAARSPGGTWAVMLRALYCLLPLACIWFPDALGAYVRGRITARSPRSFVWVLGWVVLLMPAIRWAIFKWG
jgi:Zn-finger nucleic acid-binding protein